MPKNDDLASGLQNSGFATLGKLADPESYRNPMKMAQNFFSPKKKAAKPQAMNRKQVEDSAKSIGWTVQPDGTFKKTPKADRRGKVLAKKPKPKVKNEKSVKSARKA